MKITFVNVNLRRPSLETFRTQCKSCTVRTATPILWYLQLSAWVSVEAVIAELPVWREVGQSVRQTCNVYLQQHLFIMIKNQECLVVLKTSIQALSELGGNWNTAIIVKVMENVF